MSGQGEGSFSSIFGRRGSGSPSGGTSTSMVTHEEVADRLLADNFLLTALEFHVELLESGRELKNLTQFFSDPARLQGPGDQQPPDALNRTGTSPTTMNLGVRRSVPRDMSRSASQMTLDSIDQMTRYSEDTDRREEDRVAVLEYELRTARETIGQLRTELTELASDQRRGERQVSVQEGEEEQKDEGEEEEIPIKPYERKCLNFLVNDYLVREGFKLTAITFSDECDGQDFDDWEEVGLVTGRPPSLLTMYRGETEVVRQSENLATQTSREEGEEVKQQVEQLLGDNAELNNRLQELCDMTEKLDKAKEDLEDRLSKSESEVKKLNEESSTFGQERSQLEEKLKLLARSSHHDSEVGRPEIEREDGDGASIADEPVQVNLGSEEEAVCCPTSLEQMVQQAASISSRPVSDHFQLELLRKVFPISLDSRMAEYDCDIVSLLANSLPSLVSSLVLAARSDIVPLLLYTVSRHQDSHVRDQLVETLFNLIKRPDEATRARILSGLLWLVHQPGWNSARIEGEVLPQCWEQVNHKNAERRTLVGQAVALLAPRLEVTIRGSLLVSLVSQLLDDKDPSVAITGVKSLALVANMLDDEDKLEQILQLSLGLLRREDVPKEVQMELEISLLPVLSVWLANLGQYEERLFTKLVSDIENLTLMNDEINHELVIFKLDILTRQLPYLSFSILSSCLQKTDETTEVFNLENQPSTLHPDMVKIFGETSLQTALESFLSQTSGQESSPPSHQLTRFLDLLSRLADLLARFQLDLLSLLKAGASLVSHLLDLLGNKFGMAKILPAFEEKIGPNNAILPILVTALLQEGDPEHQTYSMVLLTRWLTYVAETQDSPCSCLTTVIPMVCGMEDPEITLLVDALRECVASPIPQVRAETARLLHLLVSYGKNGLQPEMVSRRLVPAMVSLASDPEHKVVEASVAGLGCLLTTSSLHWDESQKVSLQLTGLMGDSLDQGVVLQVIQHLGPLLSVCQQEVREHLLLPSLLTAPASWRSRGFKNHSELSNALLAAYSQVPDIETSESALSGYVLPGLASLLEVVQEECQGEEQLEASVLIVMSEVEGSRRRMEPSKPRRDSTSSRRESTSARRESSSSTAWSGGSGSPSNSRTGNVKDKVNKLFNKQAGGVPFWKK